MRNILPPHLRIISYSIFKLCLELYLIDFFLLSGKIPKQILYFIILKYYAAEIFLNYYNDIKYLVAMTIKHKSFSTVQNISFWFFKAD